MKHRHLIDEQKKNLFSSIGNRFFPIEVDSSIYGVSMRPLLFLNLFQTKYLNLWSINQPFANAKNLLSKKKVFFSSLVVSHQLKARSSFSIFLIAPSHARSNHFTDTPSHPFLSPSIKTHFNLHRLKYWHFPSLLLLLCYAFSPQLRKTEKVLHHSDDDDGSKAERGLRSMAFCIDTHTRVGIREKKRKFSITHCTYLCCSSLQR